MDTAVKMKKDIQKIYLSWFDSHDKDLRRSSRENYISKFRK